MTIPLENTVVPILLLCRAGGLVALFPPFAGAPMPGKAKLVLALSIAWLLAPVTAFETPLPDHTAGLILAAVGETLIGIMMGFAVRMVFLALELAGHLIAMEIGLTMTRAVDPLTNTQTTLVGRILHFFGLMLFLVTGLHHEVLAAFAHSFNFIPLGEGLVLRGSFVPFVEASSSVFLLGVQMSAPLIAVNFVVTLMFAMLGKAVPKMNVLMVSFAVRIWAGTTVFLLTFGLIVRLTYQKAQESPDIILRFLAQ